MLSPIVYTAMWILGGFLQSDYSHIRDDISSLFAVGAPNKRLMQSFIIISSDLLFVFYTGLHDGLNDGGFDCWTYSIFDQFIFRNINRYFFPLDAGDEMTTLRGKMHLMLVIGSGVLTIAGMVALWFRLQLV